MIRNYDYTTWHTTPEEVRISVVVASEDAACEAGRSGVEVGLVAVRVVEGVRRDTVRLVVFVLLHESPTLTQLLVEHLLLFVQLKKKQATKIRKKSTTRG